MERDKAAKVGGGGGGRGRRVNGSAYRGRLGKNSSCAYLEIGIEIGRHENRGTQNGIVEHAGRAGERKRK